MKIQQFLACDAVSLSLARSSQPAATPARGFSSLSFYIRVTYARIAGIAVLRGVSGRAGMLIPLALAGSSRSPVCAAVMKHCRCEWSWHFVSEQPPGSGLLNFSCSPVAPAFPSIPPALALCFPGRKQKTYSCQSWGALMQSQPFLHPPQDRGASQTSPHGGRQRTRH